MAVNQDTSGGIVIVNLEPAGRAVQATFGGLDANRAHRLHNQVLAGEEKNTKTSNENTKFAGRNHLAQVLYSLYSSSKY